MSVTEWPPDTRGLTVRTRRTVSSPVERKNILAAVLQSKWRDSPIYPYKQGVAFDDPLDEENQPMRDSERSNAGEGDGLNESHTAAWGSGAEVSAERQRQRRWRAGEKARIVRGSFRPGHRVSDVAEHYGLHPRQWSAWRTLARKGKLAVVSSTGPEAEPVVVASEPEPEPALATLEVDPVSEPDRDSAAVAARYM